MRTSTKSCFMAVAALSSLVLAGSAFGQGMGQPRSGAPEPNAGDMAPGATAPMDNPRTPGDLHAADRSFVMAAARGGLEEVELGKLAVDKAANADVKAFGQRMVDDHSKANDQLRQVVAAKSVTLPSGLDRKGHSDYDRLAKLSGAAFDHAYVDMMVKDHVEDVADFNRAAQNAGDPDVRRFASATLPTLQEHLRMAKDLQGKVDGPSRGR
jgi:putative membrane protein